MPVKQVRAQINGTWHALTLNNGKYSANIAAPTTTSYTQPAHYYPVTIEVTDMAGNVTTKTHTDATLGSKLRLTVKEKTAPTIVILSPTSGEYLSNSAAPIHFQLKDETGGSGINLSSFVMNFSGAAAGTPTVNASSSGVVATASSSFNGYDVVYTPATGFPDGNISIDIDVRDNDGNAAAKTGISYTIDTVPPVLKITNPSAATTYVNSANFTLTGTTSDTTSGTPTVTITNNGTSVGTVTVNASGAFSKAFTLKTGSNAIIVTATDKAGKTTSVSRSIIYDTTPPTVSEVTIAPNPVDVSKSYTITVTAAD